MSATPPSDSHVTVTTTVAVPPAAAFAVFTEHIDAWWRRGPRFRWLVSGEGVLAFEGGADGRLVERAPDGEAFEIGRVLAWEPGERLAFAFRARAFAPDESTDVDVRFEPTERGGTRVVVRHGGWDAIRPDHPARHGFNGTAFVSFIGVWWSDLLVAQRAFAAGPAVTR